jgi:hypothetical protein
MRESRESNKTGQMLISGLSDCFGRPSASPFDKIVSDSVPKAEEKTVRKAQERGTFDADRKETVEKILAQTETAAKKMTTLNKKVVNADYATKHDLPSSYSRDERKLYQRIITVIDTFFSEDPQTAEKLREAIKSELSVKKK